MKRKEYRPTGHQLDPKRIETDTVQYWRNGVMMTAQMSNATAQEMVRDGRAFVISSQAIGAIINGVSHS